MGGRRERAVGERQSGRRAEEEGWGREAKRLEGRGRGLEGWERGKAAGGQRERAGREMQSGRRAKGEGAERGRDGEARRGTVNFRPTIGHFRVRFSRLGSPRTNSHTRNKTFA